MDAFLGTIIAYAPSYAPRGWSFCNGQILQISQNEALYSLIGAQYGGNGSTTFALPNLNGRVPVGANMGGTPTGATSYSLGQDGGIDTVSLTSANMPMHTHTAVSTSNLTISDLTVQMPASTSPGNTATPGNTVSLAKAVDSSDGSANIYTTETNTYLKPADVTGGTIGGEITTTINPTGSSTPFDNRQPYQAVNYIIAVEGIYPART